MDLAPLALIGGLIFALTEFSKRLIPARINGWQTQLLSFGIGVGVVFLASASTIVGKAVSINHVLLNDYDAYSKVILGLLADGLFAVVPANLFKAIDNTRSSAITSETAKGPGPNLGTPTSEAA